MTFEEFKSCIAQGLASGAIKTDALILKLRPDDPEPDEEEYERIQASRLPEPVELKPEPIEVRDGTPVYSKEELDAYHNTDEYKA